MRKVVISGMIGNALEWYDYALYAQFVPIIAKNFFPESDLAELMALAVFAAGSFMRPVGAVAFGTIGDKYGRKLALVIGILTMAIPTACIGLLPSYASIGITATIILCVIRLIQGFSLGGEFSGCIAYIVEHAPPEKRGLAGSAAFISMCVGMLLGTLTAALMSMIMLPETLGDWGWRVPFIAGLFIGLVGLYIRVNLAESPLYEEAREKQELTKSPLSETVKYYWRELFVAVGLYIAVTAPFYTSTVYMDSFLQNLGYTRGQSTFVAIAILITMIIVFPISARLSDRIGRKPVLWWGCIAMVILSYPMIAVLDDIDPITATCSQIALAAAIAFYMGPIPTVLIEIFPTKVRFTGVAVSYNLSVAIFGGTAPMMALLFERWTGNQFAVGYYLMILCLFSLYILRSYKETYHKSLSEGKVM